MTQLELFPTGPIDYNLKARFSDALINYLLSLRKLEAAYDEGLPDPPARQVLWGSHNKVFREMADLRNQWHNHTRVSHDESN